MTDDLEQLVEDAKAVIDQIHDRSDATDAQVVDALRTLAQYATDYIEEWT